MSSSIISIFPSESRSFSSCLTISAWSLEALFRSAFAFAWLFSNAAPAMLSEAFRISSCARASSAFFIASLFFSSAVLASSFDFLFSISSCMVSAICPVFVMASFCSTAASSSFSFSLSPWFFASFAVSTLAFDDNSVSMTAWSSSFIFCSSCLICTITSALSIIESTLWSESPSCGGSGWLSRAEM